MGCDASNYNKRACTVVGSNISATTYAATQQYPITMKVSAKSRKVQYTLFVMTLDIRTKSDARTTPLVTNHCILTAAVPLNKDNLMYGQISWETKAGITQ